VETLLLRERGKCSRDFETCRCNSHKNLESAYSLLIDLRTGTGERCGSSGMCRRAKRIGIYDGQSSFDHERVLTYMLQVCLFYHIFPQFCTDKEFLTYTYLSDHAEEGRFNHTLLPDEVQRQLSVFESPRLLHCASDVV